MSIWKAISVAGLVSLSLLLVGSISYFYLGFEAGPPEVVGGLIADIAAPPALAKIARQISTSRTVEGLVARSSDSRIYIDIPGRALFFDSNTYELKRDLSSAVRSMLGQLGNYSHLLILGHADKTGDSDHNYRLSKKRAGSVARMFIDSGVDPANVTALGLGEHESIESNSTRAGRAKNRRVQIEAIYGSQVAPKIVEVPTDLCQSPGTWEEALACFLKNNTWVLLIAFLSGVATLVGYLAQGISAIRAKG